MTFIVDMAMRLAPYAVPAMIFSAVMKFGFDISSRWFSWSAAGHARAPVWHDGPGGFSAVAARRVLPRHQHVLVTGFSTSSSSATLPTAIQVAAKGSASPAVTGFVMPLGATMNMSGTALYEGCVVLFVAQVYGVELACSSR